MIYIYNLFSLWALRSQNTLILLRHSTGRNLIPWLVHTITSFPLLPLDFPILTLRGFIAHAAFLYAYFLRSNELQLVELKEAEAKSLKESERLEKEIAEVE